MLNIQVFIEPGTTIIDLDRMNYLLHNLDIWLLDVGSLVSDEIAMNFASEAGWAPLAASTIARKVSGGYPLDILVRTQELKDKATSGEWSASQVGDTAIATLEIPSYGGFHIDGTSFMPARDFTFLSSSMLIKIEESLMRFLLV